MWSYRRSGSNRMRQDDRHGQPSSVHAPPRLTRDTSPVRFFCAVSFAAYKSGSVPPGSLAWYQSRHHSNVLPCMSCRPHALAGYFPTFTALPMEGPSSAPLYGLSLKFACLVLSLSPNDVAVFVPARQAYSHWASVGRRNSQSFGSVPSFLPSSVSL